jgi:hypothetical protein
MLSSAHLSAKRSARCRGDGSGRSARKAPGCTAYRGAGSRARAQQRSSVAPAASRHAAQPQFGRALRRMHTASPRQCAHQAAVLLSAFTYSICAARECVSTQARRTRVLVLHANATKSRHAEARGEGSKGSRLVDLDLPVHQLVHVRNQLRQRNRNVSASCGERVQASKASAAADANAHPRAIHVHEDEGGARGGAQRRVGARGRALRQQAGGEPHQPRRSCCASLHSCSHRVDEEPVLILVRLELRKRIAGEHGGATKHG